MIYAEHLWNRSVEVVTPGGEALHLARTEATSAHVEQIEDRHVKPPTIKKATFCILIRASTDPYHIK